MTYHAHGVIIFDKPNLLYKAESVRIFEQREKSK